MIQLDLKRLLSRLSGYTKRALENAAGLSVSRGNYEVGVEHLLLAMTDDLERDIGVILRHFDIEMPALQKALQRAVETMRSGNPGRPVFATSLVELIQDAWLLSSVELGLGQIRSGALLLAVASNPGRYGAYDWFELLRGLPVSVLKGSFADVVAASSEDAVGLSSDTPTAPAAGASSKGISADSALGRFTVNFTEQARQGKIDPVFCRDREIQQMIDILGRRRKNNPICVGDPGVGKTAVVEGLALKIAAGDVPNFLKEVELVGLDLGMLQAGAGVKGEFENRLKGIIDEVKAATKPIVLFIDEAHTLVGAGGSAGGSDAANLLKPALARGELRTVAATTWTEYKKYFEKDPALARRFQLVKLDEPSPADAVTIIRGLRSMYEKSHGVYVREDAVAAAANLSARYISGRQLPDKAVDVLDTACARVKLSISGRPAALDGRERRLTMLEHERESLSRDQATLRAAPNPRLAEIDAEVTQLQAEIAEFADKWTKEKALVESILALRGELGIFAAPITQSKADAPAAAPLSVDEIAAKETELAQAIADLTAARGRNPLVHYEVTPEAVSEVISDWTGIATGSMVKDEAASLLALGENLRKRIKGQDHAIHAIDQGMRAAKASVNNPDQPMGVFLFVGPSGVGKTELATAVSELLFGGERFLISINMSEFQEKHTVSKLVGSPPGYVGYGEGGLLTEAVRQRPYSVVLLDEVEKADLEVMNLFYQVFDKGTLSDGEGRIIDFKNTVVILTSNLATDVLTELGTHAERPSVDTLVEAIRPILSRHFKPALLARMQIVPFYPLQGEALAQIVRLKLDKVGRRLKTGQKIAFHYGDEVVDTIVGRCTEVETGARNIDHIVNKTLLPDIATEILSRMHEERQAEQISVSIGPDGNFIYSSDTPAETNKDASEQTDAQQASAAPATSEEVDA
ncbi:MAG: type VI secretion system ATPase TssH [Methylovirgula sp.]